MDRQPTQKSWRYLGVLALALTAGAVRFEEDKQDAQLGVFHSEPRQAIEPAPDCTAQLDPAWLGECTHPKAALLARK